MGEVSMLVTSGLPLFRGNSAGLKKKEKFFEVKNFFFLGTKFSAVDCYADFVIAWWQLLS